MSAVHSPFSSWRITFSFSSVLIIFLTWITLGDVDLRFSLILVTKVNAIEGVTT